MSVFVQEVLSLLRRNFVKTSLNPTDDYFQFVRKGALSRARTSAGGFAPQGQSLLISAGSWLCSQTGPMGLGRFTSTQKYSGEPGIIPVYTVPSGQCDWNTIKNSIMSQEIGVGDPMIYVGTSFNPASLTVYDRVFIPKLNPNNPSPNFRGQVVFADIDGELKTNDSFTFTNGNNFLVNGFVNTSFGSITSGASSPPTSTRVNNKLILSGPVFDAASAGGGTGLPNIGQVLIAREDPNTAGVSDGRVEWGENGGAVTNVAALTNQSIWVGDSNNIAQELPIGSTGQTLQANGGLVGWATSVTIGGLGSLYRLAMFTPNGSTIADSLLVQDGDVFTPATTVTNDGKLKLLDVPLDATAAKVLVLNPTSNIVGYRDTFVTGAETIYRVPLWSPDGKNLQSSILIQSDFIQPPSNYPSGQTNPYKQQNLTNDGNLINEGVVTLKTLAVNNSAPKILVVDSNGLVGYRDASTIGIGTVTSVSGGTSQFINTNVTNPTTTPSVTSTLSATGSPSASTFLRGDNTWAPAGTGTIAGGGTHKRLPLYTPDGTTIKDSLLSQDNDIQPANGGFNNQVLTNDGDLVQQGQVKLNTLVQDDAVDQVLVRDPNDNNILKYRSALSIGGGVTGWDVVAPDAGIANWDVVLSNGFMEVTSTPTGAFRAIRPNNVVNAQEGYFVFVATSANIPKNYLLFSGVNGNTSVTVRTTWSGDVSANFPYVPTNLDSTGQFWAQGTAVKFHYILRIDSGGNQVIWWDACCEIPSTNACPVSTNTFFITNEDTNITGLLMPSSDADGDPLTWTVVQPPVSEGVVTFNSANGQYSFMPALNFCGTGTFTFTTNDGFCNSNVATVTYNVACQCDAPIFAVSNGVGNACGAPSIPPNFTGNIGDSYTWNGDYCDVDNPATDVTLDIYFSNDQGASWTLGFDPSQPGTLTQDTTASTFVMNIPSVSSGLTLYKIEACDDVTTCCTEYIFSISAAFNILGNYELQVSSFKAFGGGVTRYPYALNTNLGMFGAEPGPYTCNQFNWASNWANQYNKIYPSSNTPGTDIPNTVSTTGGGTNYPAANSSANAATTAPGGSSPGTGTGLTIIYERTNTLSNSGGTGYPSGTNTANTTSSGGTGLNVQYTAVGGNVTTNSIIVMNTGTGYSVGDTGTIDGGNNNATWEITAIDVVTTTNFRPFCWGSGYVVGETFLVNGGSGDVVGTVTSTTWTSPPSGINPHSWGDWGDVKGRMLTNRSSVPSNMNTSGIVTNTSVQGISPSGGTYGGIAGGATFQLVNMVAASPNPTPGILEIFVFADQIPANELIAIGQTIIFNAATLDAAFAAHVGAGFNFTGDLICTIEQEDVAYAPLASSSISLAPAITSQHACNDGAYKMTATIRDAAGFSQVITIGRFTTANQKVLNSWTERHTKDSWVQPTEYVESPNGREWMRAGSQPTWGQQNYPYIIDKQYIDMTRRGLARSTVNSAFNYNHAYIPTNNIMGNFYEDYVTSGVKRLTTANKSFINANTIDGTVDFKLVGDTWINTFHSETVIKTVRSLVPGTNYSNGNYNTNQSNLTLGGGRVGFIATLTVDPGTGAVLTVAIVNGGTGYQPGDVLTFFGGNNNASVTVTTVGLGVDGTVTVTSVSGGVITGASMLTSGDVYATFQGDDDSASGQILNIPAEFICTGGNGAGAQIRMNILGASVRNNGVVAPGQLLNGVDAVTKGGTGYQVGDVLTVSADHTWVAKTHSDVAEFRLFHKRSQVTAVSLTTAGTNYSSTGPYGGVSGLPTTGGTGTGCTVNYTTNGGACSASLVQVTINNGGRGYTPGDVLTIDNGACSGSGPGDGTVTITNVGTNQEEIYNGGPFNTTGSATGNCFRAGDGTAVRVNVFTGAIEIV